MLARNSLGIHNAGGLFREDGEKLFLLLSQKHKINPRPTKRSEQYHKRFQRERLFRGDRLPDDQISAPTICINIF